MTTVDRVDGRLLPAGARLLDDGHTATRMPAAMGDVAGHHRTDTILADVEGTAHTIKPVPAPVWPLIAALRQAWSNTEPLVWLGNLPITEIPSLQKSRLAGTTVRVEVSHGQPRTMAAWTDVSRQAAAHTPALNAITDLLAHQVASDTDRMVAQTIAALATIKGNAGDALAAVAGWPGPRLVVLAPNGMSELRDWAAYGAASAGSLIVVADPYIVENVVIATAGVALGIHGPQRLTADQPSHLGVDVANMVSFALEVAPGAVATWVSTGGSGSGGGATLPTPTLISINPPTTYAGSASFPTQLTGTNFDASMSARILRGANPPLLVPATFASLTEAAMTIPASELAVPGVLQVYVVVPTGIPDPQSNQIPFVVAVPPTPTLTVITPDQAGEGAIDKIVDLTGTGFTPTMSALSQFAAEPALTHIATYFTPTRARFILPASQLDVDGTVNISVRVQYAAADSNTLPFEVVPALAQPTLTDINPDDALAGSAAVVVIMTGTNFAAPMSARMTLTDGSTVDAPATITVLGTEASFTMPDDLIDVVGKRVDVQAYVHQAVPALSVEALPFRATALTPILTALEPNLINANAGDTTVTMRGSNFESPLVAVLSGIAFDNYPGFNVTPTEAKFTIPAAKLITEGVIDVLARCQDSEPPDSNSLPFTVSGAPRLLDITPDGMMDTDPEVLLVATGENFTPDCVLYVTNTPLVGSTVVSLTEMTGTLKQGLGVHQITVRDGQGNTSQALPFTVTSITPTLTNITPDTMNLGAPAARVTFDGTNFVAGMHYYNNGADGGAVTIVSPTQCYANLAPTSAGIHQLKVGYGTGGVNSNELPLEVINPPKTTVLTSVEPWQSHNQSPVTLTLTGSGFTGPGNKEVWLYQSGVKRTVPAAVLSDTTMTATVSRPGGTMPLYEYVTAYVSGNLDTNYGLPGESADDFQIQWLASLTADPDAVQPPPGKSNEIPGRDDTP